MIVRHVSIENFRGIKSLDWHVDGRIICLVGPGDSTKTTLLDAIELALIPRWNVPLSDADFHRGNTNQPIRIRVTVGELTDELMTDDRCGLSLRGYKSGKDIVDDPDDGWDAVITVQFQVGEDLEPSWELYKESHTEPKAFSWRDRERLSMARLGDNMERHLTWSRGSSLARITEDASTGPILARANRAANQAIAEKQHDQLELAAEAVRKTALKFAVQLPKLLPGLDTHSLSFGAGALSLHDEHQVPIRTIGLGSRRLTGLAVQQIGLGPQAILLIDEIEYGLEPHRIRCLMKSLIVEHSETQDEKDDKVPAKGQVFMTTHSPTPIMALPVTELRFVRCHDGVTSVEKVQPDAIHAVQGIFRKIGHALLGRRILVCEGRTEEGICRALDRHLAPKHDNESFAYHSVVPVFGGGRSEGSKAAAEFQRVGYRVCYFGDSDKSLDVSEADLTAMGVKVLLWPGGVSTEQRIACDLTEASLQAFINKAIELCGDSPVLNAVGQKLGRSLVPVGPNISEWTTDSIDIHAVRKAIGDAAKETLGGGWFKDLTAGEELGRVIVDSLKDIPTSETAKTVNALEEWVYGE